MEGTMFSGYSIKLRKSWQSLRKLTCTSSSEALPSRAPRTSTRDKRIPQSVVHCNEGIDGFVQRRKALQYRGLLYRLRGFFRKRALSTNRDDPASVSRQFSSFYGGGNWCLMQRPITKSSDNLSHIDHALYPSTDGQSRLEQGTPRTSSASYEIFSSLSLTNDEVQSLARSGSIDVHGCESSSQRSTTGLRVDSGLSANAPRTLSHPPLNLASSVFSASSSSPQARMPFLFGLSHRARSHEVISSPLSYMSSPDLYLSNPDARRAYTSALQSPNMNRLAASPDYQEGYRVRSTSDTPVFRSFRQFPFEPFHENQECLTYGLPQQVFMWEANMFLAGVHAQDQYRDLRLDIDHMSYEELLALEERIGSVCTGLKKEMISGCLKSHVYTDNIISGQEDAQLKCSICQVDYEEGSELGMLRCGHNHHFRCIEEWLLLKDQCPICKTSAS